MIWHKDEIIEEKGNQHLLKSLYITMTQMSDEFDKLIGTDESEFIGIIVMNICLACVQYVSRNLYVV